MTDTKLTSQGVILTAAAATKVKALLEAEGETDLSLRLAVVDSNPYLLTLGITPTRPETGYGYIQMGEESDAHDEIHKIKTFTEKPNLEWAKVFYESGEFLWNSGIFLWKVETIIDALRKYLPDIVLRFDEGRNLFNTSQEKDFIAHTFSFLQNISIDYGVLEKADNVYVIKSDFGWSDLGTWGSLYEVSPKDEDNNASLHCKTLYIESTGNIVTTNDNKLVVLQGMDDYIVVESDNVLLICKKQEEQRIKHFLTDVKFRFGEEYI